MRTTLIICAVASPLSPMMAQKHFPPGYVYQRESPGASCAMGDPEWIREMDPVSGMWRVFVDDNDGLCVGAGMCFTPDGTRLRVANWWTDTIMDFDPAGNGVLVYDRGDGLSRPGNFNGMAFDRQGNFFVVNEGNLRIIKFPRDERLPQVFADRNDGIVDRGGLVADSAGNLYLGQPERILRFSPAGEGSIFDDFGRNASAGPLTIDDHDNLFVGVNLPDGSSRIYRYDAVQPALRRELANSGENNWYPFTITLSPDQTEVYMLSICRLWAFNAETGQQRVLLPCNWYKGSIIAVYVPPRAGDLNYDKVVDLADFELFADCLAGPGITDPPLPCPAKRFTAADLTRDGDVDAEDFSRLQSALDRP